MDTAEHKDSLIIGRLYAKLSKQHKAAIFGGIVFGLMAHIYSMTNVILSRDNSLLVALKGSHPGDQPDFRYRQILEMLGQGRTLGRPIEELDNWLSSPVMSGIILILAISASAAVLVDILEIRSSVCSVFTAALLVVFPSLIEVRSMASIAFPICILAFTVAIYMIVSGKNLVLSFIILFFALSIYPVYFGIYLTIFICRQILDIAVKGQIEIKILKRFLLTMIPCGLAFFILNVLGAKLMGNNLEVYQNMDEVADGSFLKADWAEKLQTIAERWWAMFTTDMMTTSRLQRFGKIALFLPVVFSVCFLIIQIRQKKDRKQITVNIVLTVVLYLLLPFAVRFMSVLTTDFNYTAWHKYPQIYVFVLLVAFADRLLALSDTGIFAKVGYIAAQIVTVFLIYGFLLFDNIGYYNNTFSITKDFSFMNRVVSTLEAGGEYEYSDPVYFVPVWTYDYDFGTSPAKPEYSLYHNIMPDPDSLLWLNEKYCYGYAYLFLGLDLAMPDGDQIAAIEAQREMLNEKYGGISSGEYYIEMIDDVYVVVFRTVVPPSIYAW